MALNLDKRTETLSIVLSKKKISKIKAQVASMLDRSGSMDNLYASGLMQEYINRLIPLGLRFDDNGSIDNWAFHDQAIKTDSITLSTVDNFIKSNIMRIPTGGTHYFHALNAVQQHYFGQHTPKKSWSLTSMFRKANQKDFVEEQQDDPVYLIFQTDGENSDPGITDSLLAKLESQAIYIQFVGVGNCPFSFIKKMADKYSNVGFFSVKDLDKVSDEELYELLINDEFKTFLKTRFPNNIQEIC